MSYYVIHGGTAGNGNGGVTTYTLTMAVSPEGGGTTSPAVGVHTYDEGTVVDVSAVAAAGYTFDHWEDDLSGSTNPTTITIDGNKLVTAVFAVEAPPTTYTLTMIADPVVAGSTSPSVGVHTYAANTVVAVSATAYPGFSFSHWSGDLTGTTNPTTITMDSDKTVTANFTYRCVICQGYGQGTPTTWTVVISGMITSPDRTVFNGTWTLHQNSVLPCSYGSAGYLASPQTYPYIMLTITANTLDIWLYVSAGTYARYRAGDPLSPAQCDYDDEMTLADSTGGFGSYYELLASSSVTLTSGIA